MSRVPPGLNIAELLRPEAFPHPVQQLDLVETHISWIVLTGHYAYKIKKPVHFDFVDAATPKRRKRLCEEEFRLNQRLAAELYVDVVTIGRTKAGVAVGASENVIEYAVRMLQFDRTQELAALLDRRDVQLPQMADLAGRLADFHRRSPSARPDSSYGEFEQIRDVVASNLGTLASLGRNSPYANDIRHLENWLEEALERLRSGIEFRKLNGMVRECHGDLHARNIVRWQGRLIAFDCLEFDPKLRWIDTADEMAFLYMDLIAHQRPDLAGETLSRYLERCGDYESLRFLKFYSVHRALIRAKVDAIQTAQALDQEKLRQSAARFEARLAVARELSRKSRPLLILMHGVSGSGKSWLSEQLVPELAAIRVRSDIERKRIAGVAPAERMHVEFEAGLYSPDNTEKTYVRLAECAEHALAGGHSVIVDAAFLDAAQRGRFMALAQKRGHPVLILACSAALQIMRTRLKARAAAGTDPSDADQGVLERQCGDMKPFTERERYHVIDVDTTTLTSASAVAAQIRRLNSTGSTPDTPQAWR